MEVKEYKNTITNFVLLFILSVGLLVLDNLGLLKFIHRGADVLIIPVKSLTLPIYRREAWFLNIIDYYQKGNAELTKLKEQLQNYETLVAENHSLRAENQSFRKQLEAPLPSTLRYIPAHVLGLDRYLSIDKGEDDGVKLGLNVVVEKIYVGKVVSTTSHTANVMLPFDPGANISAKTSRNSKGIVRGEFGNQVILDRVLQKDQLFLDDQVLTAGMGGYVPDLIIGKIDRIDSHDYEVYKKGHLTPILDLSNLDNVFVVEEL